MKSSSSSPGGAREPADANVPAAGRGRSQHGAVDVRDVAVVGGHDDDSVGFGAASATMQVAASSRDPTQRVLVAPIEVVVDCVDNGTQRARWLGSATAARTCSGRARPSGPTSWALWKRRAGGRPRTSSQCRVHLEAGALGLAAFDPLPG